MRVGEENERNKKEDKNWGNGIVGVLGFHLSWVCWCRALVLHSLFKVMWVFSLSRLLTVVLFIPLHSEKMRRSFSVVFYREWRLKTTSSGRDCLISEFGLGILKTTRFVDRGILISHRDGVDLTFIYLTFMKDCERGEEDDVVWNLFLQVLCYYEISSCLVTVIKLWVVSL